MARRLSKTLDTNYSKAINITRTESHRAREAGFHDSAKSIDSTLKQGATALRLVKTWHTMKDSCVRPNVRYKTKSGWKTKRNQSSANHQKMEGVMILADEYFDLGGGIKTLAPGQSGDAKNDCNCRCYLSYDLMTAEEFVKNGGKLPENDKRAFTNQGNSGIIKTDKQFGKKVGKHAADWGLNAASAEDRRKMEQIIDDIYLHHDTPVRVGTWRGQVDEVLFYIKEENVVITKQDGEFVTILKGGKSSGRVKNARKR